MKLPATLFLLPAFILLVLIGCHKQNPPCGEIFTIDILKGSSTNIITINGKNFGTDQSAITVKFNGLPAAIISLADTLIKVRVPENVTTGKISISINGCTVNSDQDFVALPGKWARKADLPISGGRAQGLGFSIGNKGYYFAGTDNGDGLKDLYEYDPLTDQWTQKADCGIDFEGGVRMVINGKVYAGLGNSRSLGSSINQLWEYDPVTNQWTRKADFPGALRSSLCGIGLGNKGYVGVGGSSTASLRDWWEYDPASNSWTQKADLPSAVSWYWPTTFSMNNKIYAGLGSYGNNNPGANELWEYDPAGNLWQKKTEYPGTYNGLNFLDGASSFTIGTKAYVVGGGRECWEYDVVAKTWKQIAFYANRMAGTSFSIGNKGYYMTGSDVDDQQHLQKDFWEYDPAK